MKIETPENFDDGITYVAPKMKTLKEKKEKLIREMLENKKLTKEMIDEISEIDEEISKIKTPRFDK